MMVKTSFATGCGQRIPIGDEKEMKEAAAERSLPFNLKVLDGSNYFLYCTKSSTLGCILIRLWEKWHPLKNYWFQPSLEAFCHRIHQSVSCQHGSSKNWGFRNEYSISQKKMLHKMGKKLSWEIWLKASILVWSKAH